MLVHSPKSPAEIAELVRESAAAGGKLEVRGHGTKALVGASTNDVPIIDLSAIAGVVNYDPAELVLTALPGTPLAEVEALLAARNQMLAFDPFDPTRGQGKGATIGGVVAAGLAGSRRLTRGSVRDHLLGFTAVSGRGEVFVAGGKVVKNVTGFDLSKLMCGSWGRLGVITELTLKVLPAAKAERTLTIEGLTPEDARTAMVRALGSRAEVAAAAYLPARLGQPSRVLLRLEGIEASISARRPILSAALGGFKLVDIDSGTDAWREIARLACLSDATCVWRVALPSREMPALAQLLDQQGAVWFADWAGGLIWTDWPAEKADMLRAQVGASGGHAMLMRADEAARARVPVFHPQGDGLARLEARVRRAFDPSGVFETGRFGGINAN